MGWLTFLKQVTPPNPSTGKVSLFVDTSDGAAKIVDETGAVSELATLGATSTTATAGLAPALPLTPTGYVTVMISGVAQKIPYYDV